MTGHARVNRVWRVLLEQHDSGRRVAKTVHADSEREAAGTALRSQVGAWFVVNIKEEAAR